MVDTGGELGYVRVVELKDAVSGRTVKIEEMVADHFLVTADDEGEWWGCGFCGAVDGGCKSLQGEVEGFRCGDL